MSDDFRSKGHGEMCPLCASDKVGEVVIVEEVRALEQGGKVLDRTPYQYGSPRYVCGRCGHEFEEPSYPVGSPYAARPVPEQGRPENEP